MHRQPIESPPQAGTENLETVAQPLLQWPNTYNMALGEGLDTASDQPTGNICLSNYAETGRQLLDERTYTAFFMRPKEDPRREIESHADSHFDFDLVANAFYNSYDEASADDPYQTLIIDVQIETMTEGLDPEQEPTCGEWTNSGEGLPQFIQDCGDRYLSNQTYGGHVFIYTNLNEIRLNDEELYDTILDALPIGGISARNITELEQVLADHMVDSPLEFWVDAVGLPQPVDGTAVSASEVLAYLEEVRGGYCELVDGNCTGLDSQCDSITPAPERCGAVISQDFSRYTDSHISSCEVTGGFDRYTCYADLQEYLHQRLDWIEEQIRWTEDVWINKADYHFPEPRQANIDTFQEANQKYRECADPLNDGNNLDGKLLTAKQDCTAQLEENAGQSELCAACAIPVECNGQMMNGIDGSLPDVSAGRLFGSRHPQPYSLDAADTPPPPVRAADQHCMFAGIQGNFRGLGEEARLELDEMGTPNTDDDEWNFIVKDGNLGWPERVIGSFNCWPTSYFVDHRGVYTEFQHTPYKMKKASDSAVPFQTGKFATALQGISGKMEGGGEWAEVVRNSLSSQSSLLDSDSQQGSLYAWASSFGATEPTNDVARFDLAADQKYKVEIKPGSWDGERSMAKVDEAACFITRLSGNFDTEGESVRIVEEDERWYLRASAHLRRDWFDMEYRTIRAEARCYMFEQR